MQLNIYLISHPIIKILSNSTIQNEININNKNEKKYLSLFIIYEIMRKHLYIKNIYIKQIFNLKTIYTLDSQQQNYIITNLSNTYFVLEEINNIIPNLHIININYLDLNNYTVEQLTKIVKNKKYRKRIIVFEFFLTNITIIEVIKVLIDNIKIKIEQLDIACLTCNNKVLKQISQKYPKVNIYTTKIII
uniref:Uracil phosphoribosyltransferase n=1 Tax=Caloglossa beccarii TaxID=131038 RepID=A0A1Z1M911_9FLOR|nr:uracil phosphoribosyltransferase [Caloglossa beccarii]ARW62382.1 uracil phosphoribosyltransferase [Caloglossa beccarii]